MKNQAVIDAYLKLNKDKSVKYPIISFFSAFVYVMAKSGWNLTFIRSASLRAQFASVDEIHKEEIRREKRR